MLITFHILIYKQFKHHFGLDLTKSRLKDEANSIILFQVVQGTIQFFKLQTYIKNFKKKNKSIFVSNGVRYKQYNINIC